ncbi:ImmA/IrrE family metallo-endopeptidase [Lactiplantibacillus mudanjiangensis]|uniref:ImmA/IrrE family metallo-endopeptidase n=1 Tax=Lactiplantibacillus mudanjiangensis TaxID=1296538 RepID=UPI001CDBCF84
MIKTNIDYESQLEIYESAKDISHEFLNRLSKDCQIPIREIRFNEVINYIENHYGVLIMPYEFKSIARRIMSGSLLINHGGVAIGYNSTMIKDRQNFTILHEFGHYLQTKRYHLDNQSYSDLLSNRGYSDDELKTEHEANMISSYILAPKEALSNLIHEDSSFYRIGQEFKMSRQATYMRLFDQLTLENHMQPITAKNIIRDFEDGKNDSIKDHFNRYIPLYDEWDIYDQIMQDQM